MKLKIASKSKEQGFSQSRLPELSPEEIEYIRGTADFFGLNAYCTYSVYRNGTLPGYSESKELNGNLLLGQYSVPSYADDVNARLEVIPEYNPSFFFTVS